MTIVALKPIIIYDAKLVCYIQAVGTIIKIGTIKVFM